MSEGKLGAGSKAYGVTLGDETEQTIVIGHRQEPSRVSHFQPPTEPFDIQWSLEMASYRSSGNLGQLCQPHPVGNRN